MCRSTPHVHSMTRTFRGGKRDADAALAKFVLEVGSGGMPLTMRRWASSSTSGSSSPRLTSLRRPSEATSEASSRTSCRHWATYLSIDSGLPRSTAFTPSCENGVDSTRARWQRRRFVRFTRSCAERCGRACAGVGPRRTQPFSPLLRGFGIARSSRPIRWRSYGSSKLPRAPTRT
jgi:hypothetical protein